jgi:hypothetical protein
VKGSGQTEQAHPSVEQRAYSGQRITGGPGAQAHFMLVAAYRDLLLGQTTGITNALVLSGTSDAS